MNRKASFNAREIAEHRPRVVTVQSSELKKTGKYVRKTVGGWGTKERVKLSGQEGSSECTDSTATCDPLASTEQAEQAEHQSHTEVLLCQACVRILRVVE